MNLRIVFLSLLSIVVFSSCKKQNDNVFLSNEGTQGFDGYSYTDSFSLLTSTIREDSLKSDSLSHNLIGVINDPLFGKYEASSFCQFKLPQIDKVISSQTLDSAVLFIQFTSDIAYYGDLNSVMSFKVHELTQSMNGTVTHSNQSYAYDPTPVGSFSGKFKMASTDSMNMRELGKIVKGAPGISIKLSAALATKLFNADINQLHSSDNFIQFFKGLAFVTDANPVSGSGAVAAFNLQGSFSKIRIYYNDSLQSDFSVIDGSRRFTKYSFSNQGTAINTQKSSGIKGNFDSSYILSMTGAKTRIRIPYLFSAIKDKSKKISVGKAELIVRPVAGTYTNPFTLPTRLLVLQPDPDTYLNAGIIDLLDPYSFYGGKYNSISNEYRFNITRHIQGLFSDYQLRGIDNNRGLFLVTPSDYPIAPSRIVLDTRKNIPNAGIEFKLIYTEL